MSNDQFDTCKKLIYEASGITFTETNRPVLENRIHERLRTISHSGQIGDYLFLLQKDNQEMESFLDLISNHVTRFFRNTYQISAFEKFVVPALVQQKKTNASTKQITLWSAGCSSGEEPYTLAIVLQSVLPSDFSYQVIATDISSKSLTVGQEGIYPANRLEGVPPSYFRYFEKQGNNYKVIDSIKNHVSFQRHNLKFPSRQRDLDVIFCCNVLIYFDLAAQQTVLDHFWNAMGPNSFLFIGHSESLLGTKAKFNFLLTDWTSIYTKKQE